MNELKDIVIGPDEVEYELMLRQWWSWLPIDSLRPWYLTQFGDWILSNSAGKVVFLDALEGALTPIADSKEIAAKMFSESNHRDHFFSEGLIKGLNRRGLHRGQGETFAYQIHPILGGKVEAENIRLLQINVWQALCGQIHAQSLALPPGTPIRGLEVVRGLQIRLVT